MSLLSKVLSCRDLPSLPAVAIEVLELTRHPDVALGTMADVIQKDPALSAKLLRTVNSSYYGLTTPCGTVPRALGYLGMKTIKSILLGFSLVDVTKTKSDVQFDFDAFWRRALYSAAAARVLATATQSIDPDEAFVGALFQDLGMLACATALPAEYGRVLAQAGGLHSGLCEVELDELGFTHAEAGACLAERWKLPQMIVTAMRFHHDADASAPESRGCVRMVSLGWMAAEALCDGSAGQSMAAFIKQAQEWFPEQLADIQALMEKITKGARELGKLFDRNLGGLPDVGQLMAEAQERLLQSQIESDRETMELQNANSSLVRAAMTDALTGAGNRKHFDAESSRMFRQATEAGTPMSVLFIDADRFKSINDTHGHQVGDVVLQEIVRRARRSLPESAVLCRYGGEEFAVLLPQVSGESAAVMAETLRAEIGKSPIDASSASPDAAALQVTVSIGLSSADMGTTFPDVKKLVQAADDAVYCAKRTGRNRVCIFGAAESHSSSPDWSPTIAAPLVASASGPAPNLLGATPERQAVAAPAAVAQPSPAPKIAAPPTPRASAGTLRLLLVEDDLLSAKLLETFLKKHCGVEVTHLFSAEQARVHLNGPGGATTDLMVCDDTLPRESGVDLLRWVRMQAQLASVPVVILTALQDAAVGRAATEAGASMVANKLELCQNPAKVLKLMIASCRGRAPAAVAAA